MFLFFIATESFQILKTQAKVLVDGKGHHGFPVPWAFVSDGGVGGESLGDLKSMYDLQVSSKNYPQKDVSVVSIIIY